ncbi:MAG: CRTAC1 family protein, partial [Longimicrobiales bacterium]
GHRGVLGETLDSLDTRLRALSASAAARLDTIRGAAAAAELSEAAAELAVLQAELQPLPAFRADRDALLIDPGGADLLLTQFVLLPAPTARPAPPDTGVRFVAEPLDVGDGPSAWVRALSLEDDAPLAMIAAKPSGIWVGTDPESAPTLALGHASTEPLARSAVATLDYDYDFRMDLAVAGPGGFRLLRQDDGGGFTDVSAEALPRAVATGDYVGVWAADLDMEGDMDLVLARADGPPQLLVNRGDGRFETRAGLDEVAGLREFLWADLDADGDPDIAALDADGRLHVFRNQRQAAPQFEADPLPAELGSIHAVALADLDHDARLDLILLDAAGRLRLLSRGEEGWQVTDLGEWPGYEPGGVASTRLFAHDFDNNGVIDLVGSTPAGSLLWLSTAEGLVAQRRFDSRVTDVADISGEGRLDLISVSRDGAASWLANRGTRDYFATTIRPRAAGTTGDQRINSFGIGGEIEARAGLSYQKQPIQGPTVHFGLGPEPQVDVARIIWPNGTVQAEFNLSALNESAVARQRLKGSCPWVFAFDGHDMRFITDFLWRTALGLRINAQGEAAVIHSEDWVRIPGDRLAQRDGLYDVRITAELWETHFFDHVALLVVDHPDDTEIFVDERFTLPAPVPAVHAVEPLRAVARATDHRGRDVTDRIRRLDEVFLDTFERGPYQGVAAEHYIELELGADTKSDGSLWLVASGWVYPTDSSINLAIGQGEHATPRGIQLEVPDGRGGWTVVERDLGFPAGKTKTMLIDLTGVFTEGAERRLRLRTNMEIYWDRIAWAAGRPDAAVWTRRLSAASAELRYRGFSAVRQAGRTSPELPDYQTIAATTPQWRDLVGYYTRFGDVRPLIETVDDRYVIMNAGDELALRFPALPDPAPGWTRDYVLIGDGWVKDGDYNTGFSTTVLPLPYHGMTDYSNAPDRLQDDPGYLRHPQDWELFHTRYVTPREFHRALLPERDG